MLRFLMYSVFAEKICSLINSVIADGSHLSEKAALHNCRLAEQTAEFMITVL
jgi:hypothetical protein